MATNTVYNAFKDRLVSQFGATYGVVDWEQIETGLQQQDAPFLSLDDGGGTATLESIGSPQENWNRDTGMMVVHIFVPSTGPLSAARQIGDLVRTAFQFYRWTSLPNEVLRCMNVDPPSDGVIHDGRWHSVTLSLDYEHEFTLATAT